MLKIPLLRVGRTAVVRIDHARPVLVPVRHVVGRRQVALGREAIIPVEDAGPGCDRIGGKSVRSASLNTGRFAERRSAKAVKQIALVHDSVRAAKRPVIHQAIGKSDARAEVAVGLYAEVVLAGADTAGCPRNRTRPACPSPGRSCPDSNSTAGPRLR